MRKLLQNLSLPAHTIARDLTVGLVCTIAIVFGMAGTINYFYSLERDTAAMNEKAAEIMDNLASVLVTPLWNLNTEELEKIIDVYRQSGIVWDIRLEDDNGDELVAPRHAPFQAKVMMSRAIIYEKAPIGRITVAFSDDSIIDKQQEIAVYSGIVLALLTLALTLVTRVLLRRFLNDPIAKLKAGLDVISDGNYTHVYAPVRQRDINDITMKVMHMAKEIARRESALEENRNKLEILNQAILDIFSCSDADNLLRTAITLTNKVCNVDQCWFLAHPAASSEERDGTSLPQALMCLAGSLFEATAAEAEQHMQQPASERAFSFTLKSRYRVVGTIKAYFDETPDPSVASLLKSLMSLATLALIRQSFIRETALNAAELQVAETVQRSMLPDESRAPSNALLSYHYEPVLRVGGDWFSIIESKDGNSVYALLGDVTGHGLAQGLVTTAMSGALQVVESLIHDYGATGVTQPSQIVHQLNQVITRIAGKSNLHMTCVAAKLDFTRMTLTVCNAGHTFPLLLRQQGNGEKVKALSLTKNQQCMLGEVHPSRDWSGYSDAEYAFNDSDMLLLYTDGLTEAVSKDGKSFARTFHRHFNRLDQAVSVTSVRDDLIRLFKAHTHGVAMHDDICLLILGKRQDKDVRAA